MAKTEQNVKATEDFIREVLAKNCHSIRAPKGRLICKLSNIF
jgi:hypothetical protein